VSSMVTEISFHCAVIPNVSAFDPQLAPIGKVCTEPAWLREIAP